MKLKLIVLVLVQTTLALSLFAYDDCDFEHTITVSNSRELHFDSQAKNRELLVDNFNGPIHVEGYNGDVVLLEVTRVIHARSKSRLQVAQNEVSLEIKENGDAITLYVDGPFRCGDGKFNHKGCNYYGYRNRFEFKVRIPYSTNIHLRTINGGDIEVENIIGQFDLNNINGAVTMRSISGSGKAYALNGDLTVSFSDNPENDSFFGSLNGEVAITFQPQFNADLFLKTFNGDAYTDFKTTHFEQNPPLSVHTNSNGFKTYKTNEFNTVQVGNGGPELKFDAFNGDILIKKKN